jgi:hypothetical protein
MNQQSVLALKEIDKTASCGMLENLLAQADAGKAALNECRNRYHSCCTISGATES